MDQIGRGEHATQGRWKVLRRVRDVLSEPTHEGPSRRSRTSTARGEWSTCRHCGGRYTAVPRVARGPSGLVSRRRLSALPAASRRAPPGASDPSQSISSSPSVRLCGIRPELPIRSARSKSGSMRTVEQFDELVCVTYDDLQQSARESEEEMEAARTRGRPLEAAQKPRTAADLDLGGGAEHTFERLFGRRCERFREMRGPVLHRGDPGHQPLPRMSRLPLRPPVGRRQGWGSPPAAERPRPVNLGAAHSTATSKVA